MKIVYRHVARAVIQYHGKILIAQLKGAHSFLPGGGVELGETCEMTLERELFEELGYEQIKLIGFIGVMEDSYEENETIYHSISHVFEVEVNEEELRKSYPTPESKESHLQFYWLTPSKEELERHNVLSRSVPELVSSYLIDHKARFFTDIEHTKMKNVL